MCVGSRAHQHSAGRDDCRPPQRRGHDGGRHGICGAKHRPLRQPPLQDAGHGSSGSGRPALHRLSFQRHGMFTHTGGAAYRSLPAAGRHRGGDPSALQPSGTSQGAPQVRGDLRRAIQDGRVCHRRGRQVALGLCGGKLGIPSAEPRIRLFQGLPQRKHRLHQPLGRPHEARLVAWAQGNEGEGLHHAPDQQIRPGVHRAEQEPAFLPLRGTRVASLPRAGST